MIERCGRFLDQIREKHSNGQNLAMVVHGGSLRGVICAACGLPAAFYRNVHLANAGLSILDVGDRPSLRLLNDTCHLDSVRVTEEEEDSIAS